MKTVNFLEALEANKTKRITRLDTDHTYPVGMLRDAIEQRIFYPSITCFETQWQIEPEVIEFECEWDENKKDLVVYPFGTELKNDVGNKIRPLIGKRTKVRIEVLE